MYSATGINNIMRSRMPTIRNGIRHHFPFLCFGVLGVVDVAVVSDDVGSMGAVSGDADGCVCGFAESCGMRVERRAEGNEEWHLMIVEPSANGKVKEGKQYGSCCIGTKVERVVATA